MKASWICWIKIYFKQLELDIICIKPGTVDNLENECMGCFFIKSIYLPHYNITDPNRRAHQKKHCKKKNK